MESKLTDISPLSNLTNLKVLELCNNGLRVDHMGFAKTTAGKNAEVLRNHKNNGCHVTYNER